ncbi:MAG: class I SAM-dependent methyltransferase [Acidimicrobiales bacterium]|jgi:SAM-dependent methyltransferase
MTGLTDQPEHEGDLSGHGQASGTAPVDRGDAEWDERYASAEQVWSGEPNSSLVSEVEHLEPGTALDVGCGEGADAMWLGGRGWRVTAIDVSDVALQRAARAARQSCVHVHWVHAGLLDASLPPAGFDLVSAHYAALLHTPAHDAERRLLAAVAPGGHLLVVHHADVDTEEAKAHGFDPADYVSPGDVASFLDDSWQVTFDERRPRRVHAGAGAGHSHDVVLHARRLS